jgi:hypothetical protein
MVEMSQSHTVVMESIDRASLEKKAAHWADLEVFFLQNLERMDSLQVAKRMYTGPLKQMKRCNKYMGRVLGSYSAELAPEKNTEQLENLRKDVSRGHHDSASAVGYFNDEAFALHDADRRIQKSYGGCFTCLRQYDSLTVVLDSLKGFILEPDASNL